MALTGLGPYANTSTNSSPLPEDNSKKIRKPYTITKSRESWTEPEHDKFLEALQLFDRDWKKIEAFIGSKTVIQIRSHAQKYFQKVQKTGTNEHLPPPRPKRKAAHPYPQKASKNVLSSVLVEPGIVIRPESNSMLLSPSPASNSVQTVNMSHGSKVPIAANNCCSSTESNQRAPHCDQMYQEKNNHPLRVLPDFTQVYTFIGSVFDPNASDHLQKLKKMNPIDIETVLLLMRNLSINLTSPDFEDHRRLLSSSEIDTGPTNNVGTADKENYNDQAQTVA